MEVPAIIEMTQLRCSGTDQGRGVGRTQATWSAFLLGLRQVIEECICFLAFQLGVMMEFTL